MLEQKQFFESYNIASATYTYGRILGSAQGKAAVSTVGSSTTVTATTSGSGPFDAVSAGDIIVFCTSDQTFVRRKVASKTSNDEIVINTATTLTACVSWWFFPFQSGTAVTDGWHSCKQYDEKQVHLKFTVLADGAGASVSVEVKAFEFDSTPVQIFTKDYATGTLAPPLDGEIVMIPELAHAVRVGIKGATFSGTDDFSAWFLGMLKA